MRTLERKRNLIPAYESIAEVAWNNEEPELARTMQDVIQWLTWGNVQTISGAYYIEHHRDFLTRVYRRY